MADFHKSGYKKGKRLPSMSKTYAMLFISRSQIWHLNLGISSYFCSFCESPETLCCSTTFPFS